MTNTKTNVPTEKKEPVREAELTIDRPVFTPATDICESENAIHVVCDMPGVDEKGVNVTLEDDVLTITGTQEDSSFEGLDLVHRGYRSGLYRRVFTLSTDVDRDRIGAKISSGVLRIVLPKAEEAPPRRIAVEAG